MRILTQKEQVLADLTEARRFPYGRHHGGVCGSRWLAARLPRYAARVGELRAEGYRIATSRCKEHKTAIYTLETL